jgi:molybdopterin-containing oxidoreductase family membrane subunit
MFYPSVIDVCIFIGSIGVFFTLFLLFLRVLPAIAMAEVKLLLKSSSDQSKQKIIRENGINKVHADFYQESLIKYDSVSQERETEYAKN